MLAMYVRIRSFAIHLADRWLALASRRSEQGQASAEYALVLLGVAAIALLVTAWAARTDGISRLLDAVLDKLLMRAKSG